MIVELNHIELELLEKALDCYERDAASGAMFAGLLGAVLSPKEEREETKSHYTETMAKAQVETTTRKRQSTLLRAKLYQAAAKESEHSIEAEQPSSL